MNKQKDDEEQLRQQRQAVAEIIAGTREEIAKYTREKEALLLLIGKSRNVSKQEQAVARLKDVDRLLDVRINSILPRAQAEYDRLITHRGLARRGVKASQLPASVPLPSVYTAKGMGHASTTSTTTTTSSMLPMRFTITNKILPAFYASHQQLENTIGEILGQQWQDDDIPARQEAIIGRGTTIGMMGHGGKGMNEGHTKLVLAATYKDQTAVRKSVTRSNRKDQRARGQGTEITVSIPQTQRPFFRVPRSTILARTVPLGMCGMINKETDEYTTLALSKNSKSTLLEMFSDHRNDIMRTRLSTEEAAYVGNLKEEVREEIHGAVHDSIKGLEIHPEYAIPGSIVLDKEIEFFGDSGFAHFCVYDGPRLWRKAEELWNKTAVDANGRRVRYVVEDQIRSIGTDEMFDLKGPGSDRQRDSFKKWFVLKCVYNVVRWRDGAPHLTKLKLKPKPIKGFGQSEAGYRSELERWVLGQLAPLVQIPTGLGGSPFEDWDPMLHRMRQDGTQESIRGFLVRPRNGLGPGKLTLQQLMLWKQGGVGGGYDVWLDNICDPVQLSFKLPGRTDHVVITPLDRDIQGGPYSGVEDQLMDAMRSSFIEASRENDERNRRYMSLLVETMGLSGMLPTQERRSARTFKTRTNIPTVVEGPGDLGSGGIGPGDRSNALMAWGRVIGDEDSSSDMDISDEENDVGNLKKGSSGGSGQGGSGGSFSGTSRRGGGKKRTRRRKKKKKKKTRRVRRKRRKGTRVSSSLKGRRRTHKRR